MSHRPAYLTLYPKRILPARRKRSRSITYPMTPRGVIALHKAKRETIQFDRLLGDLIEQATGVHPDSLWETVRPSTSIFDELRARGMIT